MGCSSACPSFYIPSAILIQEQRDPVSPQPKPLNQRVLSLLLDIRFLQVIGQIIFVLIVVGFFTRITSDTLGELERRNLTPSFRFMQDRAGFEIGESENYTPDDTFGDAFRVGVVNTMRVVSTALVLTTLLGIAAGILLLSTNWLMRNITRAVVEVLRNTPLLVQLFVWYYVIVLSLPQIRESAQLPAEGIMVIPLRWLVLLIAVIAVAISYTRLPALARSLAFPAILIAAVLGEAFNLLGSELSRIELAPIAYLSNRGVAVPALLPSDRFGSWAIFILVGIVLAVIGWFIARRITNQTGRPIPRTLLAIALIIASMALGWWLISSQPLPETVTLADGQTVVLTDAQAQSTLSVEDETRYAPTPLVTSIPIRQGLRFAQGTVLSPQYLALLLGLFVYTAAFIAEIVRAGILAVPHGQIEAARALGFTYSQILRMVILPQALRVIIPPLTNQYLNLAKNSSLAIAIAFADVFQVMNTVGNQSGQSVPSILLVMAVYLVMSLIISAVMNMANKRFQLVTR